MDTPTPKRFRVALSFPGENREFVQQVAENLAKPLGRDRILYDRYYEHEFSRPNLDLHLLDLYQKQSDLIVAFLSEAYQRKQWTGLEWRYIRDLIERGMSESVMIVRFDEAEVPGLLSLDGWITVGSRQPVEIADLILARLSSVRPLETPGSADLSVRPVEMAVKVAPADFQIQAVAEFEMAGEYDRAIKYVADNWSRIKSWEAYVTYLRLLEFTGGDRNGLDRAAEMEELLFGHCPEHLQVEKNYFDGRVRGQVGFRMDALSIHNRNAEQFASGDIYALKSQFEVGQILFRIQDFIGSQSALRTLSKRLDSQENADLYLRVDVSKFLATFQMLHVIFDVSGHETCLQNWTAGNYRRCLDLAEQAIRLAEESSYTDGLGWGHIVSAFGEEGRGRPEEAAAAYDRAEKILRMPGAKRSSLIYAIFYRAAYERRRGKLDEALAALKRAELEFPQMNRDPYEAEFHEQHALIALKQNTADEAAEHMREALFRYATDSGIRLRSDWPFVRRLRSVCRTYGWNLRDFFDTGKDIAH